MKTYATVLFGLLALLALAAPAAAESWTFRFDAPVVTTRGDLSALRDLSTVTVYSEVTCGDLPLTTVPDKPMVPFKTVKILLPYGKTAARVSVGPAGVRFVAGNPVLRVAPRILPHSYDKELEAHRKARELAALEGKPLRDDRSPAPDTTPFPAGDFDNFSVQGVSGYRVLVVNLYPVRYYPAQRRLRFAPEITVTAELTAADSSADAGFRGLPADRERVKRFADSLDALPTYQLRPAAKAAADYLLVSSRELLAYQGENGWPTLVARLGKAGFKVTTAVIEDVLAGGTGRDAAEKMRNFIRETWKTQGIRYVLLGGDGDDAKPVIPVRKLHAKFVWDGETFDAKLPGDFYFACLDGSFDANGDGIFGDPKDGENGGDVDLVAEVAIGRATVQTVAELSNFVRKTVRAYDLADAGKRRTVLFVGENLFPGVYGSSYMGEVETGATTHGFKTVGYPADYPRDRLDDTASYSWDRPEITNKLNAGAYWINHIGHSAQYSNMRFTSNIQGVTNTEPYLLYTQGCMCGQFTYNDCIVERHLTALAGAFATISNSNYGLGPEDPDSDATVKCRGASQYFHRQFVDAVFAEGKFRVGDANGDSKEDNIPFMNHGTTRWVTFELNLFGDPAAPLIR